ncbi:DUF2381 family protein [Hyalangium versicolor]|uniref:DUF2381 family protein n=1 Tax=Hyalangium versicolor TaxID=2861190 RepID=UPI001CCB182B|nr:DUF2381 family protein [Hyalangium versicolor]
MFDSSPAALLALALLVGATATAQPRAVPCETGTRRIELKTEPTGEVPELCIGPELSTALLFYGAELLSHGVSVEGLERFTLVEVSNTMLRLVPSGRVMPGERFRLTVRFKDGEAPASAAFWLVVTPGQVEPFVEVYREKRTLESYQQEVQEKDTQLHQCQEDNKSLLAEKESPGRLTGLVTTGLMKEEGIPFKKISLTIGMHPGNATEVVRAFSYRSNRTVAVVLWLKGTEGMQPWQAARAELVGPGRRPLRVYPPWQAGPLSEDVQNQRVVIEADATEAESRGTFTLKLWDAEGTRSIIVTGVTFP